MRRLALGLLLSLAAPQLSSAQDGLTLTMGAFSQHGDFLKQVLSVTNKSGRFYNFVTVECGFFDHGRLVATSSDLISKLADGTTGFGSAITYSATVNDKVDNVQCRIVGVS